MPSWRTPQHAALGTSLALLLAGSHASAQSVREFGLHGLATFAEETFAGGGLSAGLRPGGRSRIALSLNAGAFDGQLAGRGEVAVHFLLNPRAQGTGVYGGGGLAGIVGPVDAGYVLLVLGVEAHPGGSCGWVVEAGLGGGFRILVGYHWRSLRGRREP